MNYLYNIEPNRKKILLIFVTLLFSISLLKVTYVFSQSPITLNNEDIINDIDWNISIDELLKSECNDTIIRMKSCLSSDTVLIRKIVFDRIFDNNLFQKTYFFEKEKLCRVEISLNSVDLVFNSIKALYLKFYGLFKTKYGTPYFSFGDDINDKKSISKKIRHNVDIPVILCQ